MLGGVLTVKAFYLEMIDAEKRRWE